jgi:porphobilinogen synthase
MYAPVPISSFEFGTPKNIMARMPSVYQISLNLLESELKEAYDLGIRAIMFFGVPNSKINHTTMTMISIFT